MLSIRSLLRTCAILPLMGCLVGLAQAPSASDKRLKATLVPLLDKFMADWQKHDAAALLTSLAPEFVYVGPHGPVPRERVVLDLTTHCTLASYKLGEPRILQTSAESAVLIYTIHQDLTCFGRPDVSEVVNTDTLMKRGGKWLFVMTTSTPLAARPEA